MKPHTTIPNDFALPNANETTPFDGFYLSWTRRDGFGNETTCIVLGEMQLFLSLRGDHRPGMIALAEKGLQACIDYFIEHLDEAATGSEHLGAYSGYHLLGSANIDRIHAKAEDLQHSRCQII